MAAALFALALRSFDADETFMAFPLFRAASIQGERWRAAQTRNEKTLVIGRRQCGIRAVFHCSRKIWFCII